MNRSTWKIYRTICLARQNARVPEVNAVLAVTRAGVLSICEDSAMARVSKNSSKSSNCNCGYRH